jgi:hypothetical protein
VIEQITDRVLNPTRETDVSSCLSLLSFEGRGLMPPPKIPKHLSEQKDRIKVASVLNQVPRHEDVWGSGGIAPHIPNLGTRLRWLISFTPRSLHPPGKTGTHLIVTLMGPRAGMNPVAKKNPCACRELNPVRPARSSVTILAEILRLTHIILKIYVIRGNQGSKCAAAAPRRIMWTISWLECPWCIQRRENTAMLTLYYVHAFRFAATDSQFLRLCCVAVQPSWYL